MQKAAPPLRRLAMLSVHTCPLAALGGKKTGGMNVYVREISREFGRRGIQVDVFTRNQESCASHIGQQIGDNARVIHIPAGPLTALDPEQIYPYVPEFTQNVLDFASRDCAAYDLIYSHYWLSGVAAHELRAEWRVPVVQMFHTLGIMKNRVAANPGDREGALRIREETELLREADAIIAATPAELAQMQWLYRADVRRVTVVPPGVDVNLFYPRPAAEAKRRLGLDPALQLLLFVGRIEPLKGIETLFQAVARLRDLGVCECNRMAVAVIGGEADSRDSQNAEMERLKQLRAELDLSELVTFLGAQDQDALPDYYAAAEAVIMPSHYESFGMVALEAMACGTPVIASEVGGLAYLVRDGETGFHVPDSDPELLADRICEILTDRLLRRELGEQAARHAQGYAWPIIADKILGVYATVLESRHPISLQFA